jgi:hypothetical protein
MSGLLRSLIGLIPGKAERKAKCVQTLNGLV